MNAELLRELSNIVDDENLLRKALNYIKSLGWQKKQEARLVGLSQPVDSVLEQEASALYGIFRSADMDEDELKDIVSDVRKEVYGNKE